jgi:hypothetical protein
MSTVAILTTELETTIRQAGVQRGINASIQALTELQTEYTKLGIQIGVATLANAIKTLQALNIDEVEG